MGSCLSKKSGSSNGVDVVSTRKGTGTVPDLRRIINGGTTSKPAELLQTETESQLKWGKKTEVKNVDREEETEKELKEDDSIVVKKEISVIRHGKSNDKSANQQNLPVSLPVDVGSQRIHSDTAPLPIPVDVSPFRTSSCTKEEVDAILIQCGRLSRTSSSKATASSSGNGRKYSGSKRSFDFDHSDREALALADAADVGVGGDIKNIDSVQNEEGGDVSERRPRHRQRNRQSPRPSPSRERRRTPSRERDQSNQRERRISRSPGRRSSETSGNSAGDNTILIVNNLDSNGSNCGNPRKPAKMVSVPATVPSFSVEKSNNGGDPASAAAIKRTSVKRNAGDPAGRAASSPRSQSPARTIANGKVTDENLQQHQPSLSRSSSRKEQSPYRRNPLSEIDANAIPQLQAQNRAGNKSKKETEGDGIIAINGLNQKAKVETNLVQGSKCKLTSAKNSLEKTVTTMGEQKVMGEDTKVQTRTPEAETLLTRSSSAVLSRDVDINPETLLQSTTSYTNLLLEDIQNFHQKNTSAAAAAAPVSLPPCLLTKACSIPDAVPDLNSTTSSNHSCTLSEDRTSPLPYQPSWKRTPVAFGDDVTEPNFHKYVTLTRGGAADTEDQESSGSNSFAGSLQNLGSSWEPTSADSSDMASKSVNSKGSQPSLARQRHGRTRKEENLRVQER